MLCVTLGKYEVEVERNGGWSGSRVRAGRETDVDGGKTAVGGGQEGARNGLTEESFVPRAREETAELVRTSSRPVRVIIDQQTDVIQLLKTTSRGVDDLESEVRAVRATFLDRQARIDTLRGAVDAEIRAYQADQAAANDRVRAQQIPGGHFVRDEFMRANNIGARSSAIEELLGGAAGPRRRSGSVSSTSGILPGGGGALPPGLGPGDLDYRSSALNSWVLDDDASSTASGYSVTRSRRGGSVVRERSYLIEEPIGSRIEASRGYLLPTYDLPSPYAFGETSTRATVTYAPTSSARSNYQTDYGSTPAASYYAGAAADSRPYFGGGGGADSGRSYAAAGYSSFGGGATADPSRFRRAQSVSEFSSERLAGGGGERAYNSAAYSTPAGGPGQFQSRFLDKVRARKALGGDDQYRSRFLASSESGSSKYSYSTRRNYSSND